MADQHPVVIVTGSNSEPSEQSESQASLMEAGIQTGQAIESSRQASEEVSQLRMEVEGLRRDRSSDQSLIQSLNDRIDRLTQAITEAAEEEEAETETDSETVLIVPEVETLPAEPEPERERSMWERVCDKLNGM